MLSAPSACGSSSCACRFLCGHVPTPRGLRAVRTYGLRVPASYVPEAQGSLCSPGVKHGTYSYQPGRTYCVPCDEPQVRGSRRSEARLHSLDTGAGRAATLLPVPLRMPYRARNPQTSRPRAGLLLTHEPRLGQVNRGLPGLGAWLLRHEPLIRFLTYSTEGSNPGLAGPS